MRLFMASIFLLTSSLVLAENRIDKNSEILEDTAFKLASGRLPPKFTPAKKGFIKFRNESNGVISFLFSSEDNKFKGEAFCNYSQLLKSVDGDKKFKQACYRYNIFETNPKGFNGFGKQVSLLGASDK